MDGKVLDGRKTKSLTEKEKEVLTGKTRDLLKEQTAELNSIKVNRAQLEQQIEQLQEKLETVNNLLEAERKVSQEVKQKLDTANKALEAERKVNEVHQVQLGDFTALQTKVSAYETKLKRLENHVTNLQEKLAEKRELLDKANADIIKYCEHIAILEAGLQDSSESDCNSDCKHQRKTERLEKENSELRRQIEDLSQDLDATIESHKAEVSDYLTLEESTREQERNNTIEEVTAEYREEIAKLTSEFSKREQELLDSHQQEVGELHREVLRLRELKAPDTVDSDYEVIEAPDPSTPTTTENPEVTTGPTDGEGEGEPDTMAEAEKINMLKYLDRFHGGVGEKRTPTEHVRSFQDYLKFHKIKDISDAAPNYKEMLARFPYSLTGDARNWYEENRDRIKGERDDKEHYENLVKEFKNEFSKYGSSRAEKTASWDNLKWDSKTETLDSFYRRLKELAEDLNKDDEDIRNQFIRAMPGYIIPAVASIGKIADMKSCVKRLIGYYKLTPGATSMSPDLQTFAAEKSVAFNQENVTNSKIDQLCSKVDEYTNQMTQRFTKVECDIDYLKRDMTELRLGQQERGRDRTRKASRSKSRSKSNKRIESLVRDHVYQLMAREPSRSYKDNKRDSSKDRYGRERSKSRSKSKENYRSNSKDRKGNYYDYKRSNSKDRDSGYKRSSSSERSKLFCKYCNTSGHDIIDCFKLKKVILEKEHSSN